MIKFRKLAPLLNRILVKKLETLNKSKGGIILDQAKSSSIGEVVAVGPGSFNSQNILIKPTVSVGDIILLPEYGGSSFKLADGNEYTIYKDDDILGILSDNVD